MLQYLSMFQYFNISLNIKFLKIYTNEKFKLQSPQQPDREITIY